MIHNLLRHLTDILFYFMFPNPYYPPARVSQLTGDSFVPLNICVKFVAPK